MGFGGQRFQLALTGGWNTNENFDDIPAGQLTEGSRNVNTHNGVAEKRGGSILIGSLIAANPTCLGGGQLVLAAAEHNYFAGSNGSLYRNGVSIQSSRSATAKVNFTPADSKMFICNGVNAVQVDTGTSIATIASPSADWTGSDQPNKVLVHNKGASRRMFGWGVPGKKNTLYYSSLGAFETFTGGTSGTIVIDFPDEFGIINCVSKDGTLFIFGREKTFTLSDDSITVSTWGSQSTAWTGGVHSPQLMVEVDNDIYAMSSDLEMYSVANAEQLRNYKRASVTRPSFIHNYLKTNANITQLDNFHMEFDPKIRAIKLWIRRSSLLQDDTALIFDVSRQVWMPPHDSLENTDDSGYEAAASWRAMNTDGEEVLRTGDYNGGTWELEDDTKADNGNAYTSELRTTWVDLELPGINKFFDAHWPAIFHFISRGAFQIDVRWFIDTVEQTSQSVALGSGASALGSFVLGTDSLGSIGPTKEDIELGAKGEKIRFYISNDGDSEDFALSHIIIPFLVSGIERNK